MINIWQTMAEWRSHAMRWVQSESNLDQAGLLNDDDILLKRGMSRAENELSWSDRTYRKTRRFRSKNDDW